MTIECIEFTESSGKIRFCYKERSMRGVDYCVNREIPKRVVKGGEEAILEYASHEVQEVKKEWERREAIEKDIKETNIPIQTTYEDGTLLEGRIIEAKDRFIKVEFRYTIKRGIKN